MPSSERILWALVIAALPTLVAVVFAPPNVYARLVVGGGALAAAFPAAYLVAGLRT